MANSTQRVPYWQFRFRNLQDGFAVIVGTFADTRNEALAICVRSQAAGWEFAGDVQQPERAWTPA